MATESQLIKNSDVTLYMYELEHRQTTESSWMFTIMTIIISVQWIKFRESERECCQHAGNASDEDGMLLFTDLVHPISHFDMNNAASVSQKFKSNAKSNI